MGKGGIERWALVEQALIYHHALLQSVELLSLRYDAVINLYKSKAHWDHEPPDIILRAQYANEDGVHLRYVVNNRVLHDKVGIVRYTPDALMSIIAQHRERSTLWRVLEQEVSSEIVNGGGSDMRLRPLRLPNFLDLGLQRYFDHERSDWMRQVPDFIDETFGKLQQSYERPDGDVVSLDAWRMRSEQPKRR